MMRSRFYCGLSDFCLAPLKARRTRKATVKPKSSNKSVAQVRIAEAGAASRAAIALGEGCAMCARCAEGEGGARPVRERPASLAAGR